MSTPEPPPMDAPSAPVVEPGAEATPPAARGPFVVALTTKGATPFNTLRVGPRWTFSL